MTPNLSVSGRQLFFCLDSIVALVAEENSFLDRSSRLRKAVERAFTRSTCARLLSEMKNTAPRS